MAVAAAVFEDDGATAGGVAGRRRCTVTISRLATRESSGDDIGTGVCPPTAMGAGPLALLPLPVPLPLTARAALGLADCGIWTDRLEVERCAAKADAAAARPE